MAATPINTAALSRRTPIDAGDARRRSWDDAPLRAKVALLVLLSAVCGCLVGVGIALLDGVFGPVALGLGLSVLIVLVARLGQNWIARPIEALTTRMERLVRHQDPHSPDALRHLATQRRDDVGRLSRLVHQMASLGARHHYEAANLRRMLDHRIAEATAAATHKLRRIALRDPLTDLGNRRFLDENLETLVDTVRVSGSDLVCILLDMDDFKQINDAHGHAAGDEILIFLAGLLRATTRREDYSVRLGGDEFCILMPGCPLDRAGEFARRLAALFRQHVRTAFNNGTTPDLSIGVASLVRDKATSGQHLLEIADANLYAAKNQGKGRIVGV